MWVIVFGGDKRDRTADLLNAIQALSQLSYTPMLPETLDFAGFLSYSIFWLYSPLRGSTPGCLRSQLSYTPEPLVLCGFRARNIDKYNKIIAKYLGEDAVPTEEADADATETPAAEEEAAE